MNLNIKETDPVVIEVEETIVVVPEDKVEVAIIRNRANLVKINTLNSSSKTWDNSNNMSITKQSTTNSNRTCKVIKSQVRVQWEAI